MKLNELLSDYDKEALNAVKNLAQQYDEAIKAFVTTEEDEAEAEKSVEAITEKSTKDTKETEDKEAEKSEDKPEDKKDESKEGEAKKSEDKKDSKDKDEDVEKSETKDEDDEKSGVEDEKDEADENSSDAKDEKEADEKSSDAKDAKEKEKAEKDKEKSDKVEKSLSELTDVVKNLANIVGTVLKAVQLNDRKTESLEEVVKSFKLPSEAESVTITVPAEETRVIDYIEKSVEPIVGVETFKNEDTASKSTDESSEDATVAVATPEKAETEEPVVPKETEAPIAQTPQEIFDENSGKFMSNYKQVAQSNSSSRANLQELRHVYANMQMGIATEKEQEQFVNFSKGLK